MRALLRPLITTAFRTFAGRQCLSILCFHRVIAAGDTHRPDELDAEGFHWRMALLAEHCNVVPLLEGYQQLAEKCLPPRAVALTFDDGYADSALVAAPILREFDLPATFFVTAGELDGGILWTHRIRESVLRTSVPVLRLHSASFPTFNLSSSDSRLSAAEAILSAAKRLTVADRIALTEEVETLCQSRVPKDMMLTSRQLLELSQVKGMAIGAHTVTHPILSAIDDDTAEREITESKTALEAIIGKPVETFAYPNGTPGRDFAPRHVEMVKRAGFKLAVTARSAAARAGDDALQLPRFTPWDKTPNRYLLRLLVSRLRREMT